MYAKRRPSFLLKLILVNNIRLGNIKKKKKKKKKKIKGKSPGISTFYFRNRIIIQLIR